MQSKPPNKPNTPKTPATPATLPEIPPEESLIAYPCHFPIKAMGENQEHYVHAVVEIIKNFDPSFDAATVELRPSSTGKYMGVTASPWVTSREQLDEIYRTLSTHPMVKVVL